MDTSRHKLYLRPTLVIGLGGSGGRIALELKARLEERLGEKSDYRRVVKFLCFDTADENLTAHYPSYPEKLVTFSAESEFVRISDVPLHDLMRSRNTNPAIASILPEVLYTTQIDQGAQQVRRLGRIALFYHYDRIKEKLIGAISALRQIDVIGELKSSSDGLYDVFISDRNRLRVFIICSVCGGTGSGTFIDMAYLVRHIAEGTGISARACDVNGMLLLPEAFPDIVTTGSARIRANAYAALLDMEYYNQAANVDEPLYQVRMPGERISVSSGPFSLCYLVGGGGSEGPIGDVRSLAPILADALEAIISSPIGTRLDATLDNVRVGLTLDYSGFRTFYSALGIAQIIHPRLEMQHAFYHLLKQKIIAEHILEAKNPDTEIEEEARSWLTKNVTDYLHDKLRDAIHKNEEGITRRLRQLENETERSRQPLSDFADAFRETVRLFQQHVVERLERETPNVYRDIERELHVEVYRLVDSILTNNGKYSLRLVQVWLNNLNEQIKTRRDDLQRPSKADLNRAYEREVSYIEQVRRYPIVGLLLFMRRRIAEACGNLRRFVYGNAIGAELNEAEQTVLSALNRSVNDLSREIQQAIDYWEDVYNAEKTALEQKPQLTLVTQRTLSEKQIHDYTTAAVAKLLEKANTTLYADLNEKFKSGDRALSWSLDVDMRSTLSATLDQFCEEKFNVILGSTSANNFTENDASQNAESENFIGDVTEYLARLNSTNSTPAQRERYNTLLVNLRTQAQPLLVYSDGVLKSVPPSEIRVVGGKSEPALRAVWTGGVSEHSDVNFAATFDPTRLTYLVTHHGIPINVLTKFDEYRGHYEKMKSARNSIFHLDNEREDEPHDPGSMYFINLEDFQSYFARTLAYGWIKWFEEPGRREAKHRYLISDLLFSEFTQLVETKKTELANTIAKIEADLAKPNLSEEWRSSEQARVFAQQKLRKELEVRLQGFIKVQEDKSISSYTSHEMHDRLLTVKKGEQFIPVTNLIEAIDALYGGDTRLIAQLFMNAVKGLERRQNSSTLLSAIDDFLNRRSYVGNTMTEDDDVVINEMKFSQPGQADYLIELHLCALLSVHRRMINKETFAKRWPPAGYHLLRRGFLGKDTQNGALQ